MKVASFIYKKNNRQVLGRYNRELVIRILVKRHLKHATCYHLVLTRRRSSANGRFDKLGYLQLVKEQKPLLVLGLNRKKIKAAIANGASLHVSVYKLLIN